MYNLLGVRFKILHLVLVLILLPIASCSDSPILVGFSGTLKGKYSDLGVQGRNGALLATEEINAAGGIDGRKLDLLVRDDENTPEGAVKADRELINAGAAVIIGHMTSVQSLAALEEFSNSDIVYISPTTSSTTIQGVKDNFFRVIPTLTDLSDDLAKFAVKKLEIKRVALLWDNSNKPFTVPYRDSFIESLEKYGGQVVGEVDFSSYGAPVNWQEIVEKLTKMNPDTVVAITAARDLAGFAQHSKLNKSSWTLLSSMWGFTKELVQTGGKSVEGIIFSVHFTEDGSDPNYADFKKRYAKRFGWEPNFAAAFSYEAVRVFAEAVRRNGGSTKGLSGILPGISVTDSIIGPYTIDEFGDVGRHGHIVKVKNGKFISLSRGGK